MKKLYLLSILFIVSCSSTPKQATADITGINVAKDTNETFKSTHGSFRIVHNPAKNEFLILPGDWATLGNIYKKTFSLGLAGLEIDVLDKFEDAIFIDVFNEYKESNDYLSGCSVTDLIRTKYPRHNGVNAIELLNKCEES